MGYDKYTYEKDKKIREIIILKRYLSRQKARRLERLRTHKRRNLDFFHIETEPSSFDEYLNTSTKPVGEGVKGSKTVSFAKSVLSGESFLNCWLGHLPNIFGGLIEEPSPQKNTNMSGNIDTGENKMEQLGFEESDMDVENENTKTTQVESEDTEEEEDSSSFEAIMTENLQNASNYLVLEKDISLVQDVVDFIKLSNNMYTMSSGLKGSFASPKRSVYFEARDNTRTKRLISVFKNNTLSSDFFNTVYALKELTNVENVQTYVNCRQLTHHSFLVRERMSYSLKEIFSKNVLTGPFSTAMDASTNGSVNYFLNLFYQMFEGITEIHCNRKSKFVLLRSLMVMLM